MIVFDEYLHSEEEYSDQYSHTIITQETPTNRENQTQVLASQVSGRVIYTPKFEKKILDFPDYSYIKSQF